MDRIFAFVAHNNQTTPPLVSVARRRHLAATQSQADVTDTPVTTTETIAVVAFANTPSTEGRLSNKRAGTQIPPPIRVNLQWLHTLTSPTTTQCVIINQNEMPTLHCNGGQPRGLLIACPRSKVKGRRAHLAVPTCTI